jgi:hypothetical protein
MQLSKLEKQGSTTPRSPAMHRASCARPGQQQLQKIRTVRLGAGARCSVSRCCCFAALLPPADGCRRRRAANDGPSESGRHATLATTSSPAGLLVAP